MTLENFGQPRLTKTSMILCSFTLEDNFQFPTKVWLSSKIDQVKQNSQSVRIANKMNPALYMQSCSVALPRNDLSCQLFGGLR